MTTDDTAGDTPDAALCAALLHGLTYDAAAQAAGCSRSTVARRMADPAFRARLDVLRTEALARVADLLAGEAIHAVHTLAEIRADPDAPASVRARAACALLDSATKYRAAVDLDARVAAVENVLNLRRER